MSKRNPKYIVYQKDLKENKWEEVGKFITFKEISIKIGYPVSTIQNIKLKRLKSLNKILKVEYYNFLST